MRAWDIFEAANDGITKAIRALHPILLRWAPVVAFVLCLYDPQGAVLLLCVWANEMQKHDPSRGV